MSTNIHGQIENDIWQICPLLHSPCWRNEYGKVIIVQRQSKVSA